MLVPLAFLAFKRVGFQEDNAFRVCGITTKALVIVPARSHLPESKAEALDSGPGTVGTMTKATVRVRANASATEEPDAGNPGLCRGRRASGIPTVEASTQNTEHQ